MSEVISLVELAPQEALVVRGHVAMTGIPEFLGSAFGDVLAVLGETAPAGMPFARYDMADDGFEIEAGFPVESGRQGSGRVEVITLPGGPAATVLHRGSYESVSSAYERIIAWFGSNGHAAAGAPWESYLDGPEVDEPRTQVTWPCRPA